MEMKIKRIVLSIAIASLAGCTTLPIEDVDARSNDRTQPVLWMYPAWYHCNHRDGSTSWDTEENSHLNPYSSWMDTFGQERVREHK